MNNKKRILILPGDGIGPEVSLIAKKLLMLIDEKFSLGIEISEGLIGGIAYEETGDPLPQETLDKATIGNNIYYPILFKSPIF